MRIPSEHKLTRALCRQLKCHLISFQEDCDKALVYLNGHRVRIKDYRAGTVNFGDPYTKCSIAKDMVEKVLWPIRPPFRAGMKRCKPMDPPEIESKQLLRLDNISWGEYLSAFVKNSSSWTGKNPVLPTKKISNKNLLTWADLDLIRFEFGAADFHASLLEFIRDDETMTASGKKQIAGGMDRLPTGFVDPERSLRLWTSVPWTRS